MINGKTLTLGGRDFVAPPAPFCIMRKYDDVFNGTGVATPLMMADVVLCALQRNYPELTQQEFEASYLDVSNVQESFKAVMNISGVKEQAPGEAQPGNA